jgi:hypothetical protein
MKKSHVIALSVALAALLTIAGCATRKPLPVADTVCVDFNGLKDPGLAFAKRKAAYFFSEYGFRLVDSGCDVSISYTNFSDTKWELVNSSLFGTKTSSTYRMDGIVKIQQGDTVVAEDERIAIKDEDSMYDLLEELSSLMSDAVREHFMPANPKKR